MCTGLAGVWQYSRGRHLSVSAAAANLPPLTNCQVINQTPVGYALRQTDPAPSPLRIGELIALRVEGRPGPQVAIVRWFRNTLKGSALEFGCEARPTARSAHRSFSFRFHRVPNRRMRCHRSSPPQGCSPSTRVWR